MILLARLSVSSESPEKRASLGINVPLFPPPGGRTSNSRASESSDVNFKRILDARSCFFDEILCQ